MLRLCDVSITQQLYLQRLVPDRLIQCDRVHHERYTFPLSILKYWLMQLESFRVTFIFVPILNDLQRPVSQLFFSWTPGACLYAPHRASP